MIWIPAATAGAFATIFCGLWWYGARSRHVDVPNERSLHTTPTPTSGGVGIIAAFVVVTLISADIPSLLFPLLLPVVVLCITGVVDDLRGLSVVTRLVLQAACAAWVIFMAESPLPVPFAALMAVFCLVGFTNAFNFMDGIDGLAATQAAFVGLAGAWLLSRTGGPDHLVLLLSVAGACSLGFLVWNWPPARLFMGDAGSLPLGLLLTALALLSSQNDALPLWCWVILWAPFLCDAGITLLLRLTARKPVFRAHREHAYQRLAAQGHRNVTVGLLIADLIGLLPLAWIAATHPAYASLAALAAVLPFIVLVFAVAARDSSAGVATT